MSPDISVIIPITDIQNRLFNLSKVLSSSRPFILRFILVCDSDLAEDRFTIERLLEQFSDLDITSIFGHFGSAGSARNAGLKVLKSEWVCFLDSDDLIEYPLLIQLTLGAERAKSEMAIAGIKIQRSGSDATRKVFIHADLALPESLGIFPGFTRFVYKKSLIKGIFFPDLSMGEDQCFLIKVLSRSPIMHQEELYFYTYRLGFGEQQTSNRRALNDLVAANKQILLYTKSEVKDVVSTACVMYLKNMATILRLTPFKFKIVYFFELSTEIFFILDKPLQFPKFLKLLFANQVKL